MMCNSQKVNSNQTNIHEKLIKIIERTRNKNCQKPIHGPTREAFEPINSLVHYLDCEVILDSGCGTGESTIKLSRLYSDKLVIGVDKSISRLAKGTRKSTRDNLRFVHAEYFDFWRLAVQNKWRIKKHYILYPNPWPKKQHLRRRIHGHPAFWFFLELGADFELRTNWQIYIEEFTKAVNYVTDLKLEWHSFVPKNPFTLFEQKYLNSGHTLYKCSFRSAED